MSPVSAWDFPTLSHIVQKQAMYTVVDVLLFQVLHQPVEQEHVVVAAVLECYSGSVSCTFAFPDMYKLINIGD